MTLFIKYAENRIALRKIKKAIKDLNYQHLFSPKKEEIWENRIDLNKYRESWCELEPGADWPGWVGVVEHSGQFTKMEIKLARLLDEKKKINVKAGHINRCIYFEGIKQKKGDFT